jgi:hypothetical protein
MKAPESRETEPYPQSIGPEFPRGFDCLAKADLYRDFLQQGNDSWDAASLPASLHSPTHRSSLPYFFVLSSSTLQLSRQLLQLVMPPPIAPPPQEPADLSSIESRIVFISSEIVHLKVSGVIYELHADPYLTSPERAAQHLSKTGQSARFAAGPSEQTERYEV